MEFDDNYIFRGTVDVAPLRSIVAVQSEQDWTADSYRQRRFVAHQHTNTIGLIYDRDFRHVNPTRQTKYGEFQMAIEPIFAAIGAIYHDDGAVIRCMVARLNPRGSIPPHVDAGFSLRHSHRLHIPVVTHSHVSFWINGEEIHMREGDLWEINNLRPHSVRNDGDAARVHLIVDWAPPMTPIEKSEYEQSIQVAAAATAAGAAPKYD